MGLFITVMLFLFRKPFLLASGASEVTFPYAESYFSIINAFIAVALLNIALSGFGEIAAGNYCNPGQGFSFLSSPPLYF
jgi:Na+-driven multidrug efflux pump